MKKNKPARKVHKRRIEKSGSTQIVIKRDWFPIGRPRCKASGFVGAVGGNRLCLVGSTGAHGCILAAAGRPKS